MKPKKIIQRIKTKNSLDEIFDCIYRELQAMIPHSRLGLALFDDESKRLVQVKTCSDKRIYLNDGYAADISGSTLEKILYSGEVRIINDLEQHFAERPSGWTALILKEGMLSSLTLPLKLNERPIGVIFFTHKIKNAFAKQHIKFLTEIVGQLSILIEKGKWIKDFAQSYERYHLLFEMSNDGIFICKEPHEAFLSFNHNFQKWLGYEYEQLLDCTLRDLTLGGYDNISYTSSFRLQLQHKDRHAVFFDMRLTKIKYHGQDLIQGVATNVTEVVQLKSQLQKQHSFYNIIGKSYQMQQIYQTIEQLRSMTTSVLIEGENGTGKELIARAVHDSSERKSKAFVAINCGAIPDTLIESELFGHVKGSYTGATTTRSGRFEIADGGTLFLDEIGELPLLLQVKLLRVLQQGEFEKLGSSTTQKVDVRIIAATNQDLKKQMANGQFRKDLYYRLNVMNIYVPPLRERRDDIPLLAQHFINQFRHKTQKDIVAITPKALSLLMNYHFSGNIRELENIIEHAFVKCTTSHICSEDFPSYLSDENEDIVNKALQHEFPLQKLEQQLIERTIEQCNGKISAAAKKLGISRSTLWRKLQKIDT